MTDIVVYGIGGMGRETAELILAAADDGARWSLLGFVDDAPSVAGTEVAGLPVLGGAAWLRGRRVAVAVAIGSPLSRRQVLESLLARGVRSLPALVHPAAAVGRRVDIGSATIVCAGAVVTTDVRIGRSAIVNVGATVSHDDVLEDLATLAPGVHLAGAVTVGEGADLGIGASVIPQRTVGPWSVVGAGATVIHDVPPATTVVGCPARVIAARDPGYPSLAETSGLALTPGGDHVDHG